ncbi:MAG: enoyl-CoA hydratase/isomerase family protein [Candidatus Bathyarchaeia archaeon]
MSTNYATIQFKQEQNIAWIILNRPEKLNAITPAMLDELSNVLDKIETDPNTKAVIITGNSERSFSTGADLNELLKLTPTTAAEFSRKGQQTFSKIETLPKPVIAGINGYALGGGLELALACDFRIVASFSVMGFPEIKRGILPAWGATQRLPLTVGLANAKRMIMLGTGISAKDALAMGLANKIVPNNKIRIESEDLALKLIEYPALAQKYVKQALAADTREGFEAGLQKETEYFVKLFSEKQTKQRIQDFLARETNK